MKIKKMSLEEMAIDYLINGLWKTTKSYWKVLILSSFVLPSLTLPMIKKFKYRYGSKALVKMGRLETRSYKSKILEKISDITNETPLERNLGYNPNDLKYLLETKYLKRLSPKEGLYEEGPFVSSVFIDVNSELLVINSEATDKEKAKELLTNIVNKLKVDFDKKQKDIKGEIINRLSILKSDHKKISKSIREIERAQKRVGFSPILTKQRNDLLIHESRLKYMIFDVESQMGSDKMRNFELVSLTSTNYKVTGKKKNYVFGLWVLNFTFNIILLVVLSILLYFDILYLIVIYLVKYFSILTMALYSVRGGSTEMSLNQVVNLAIKNSNQMKVNKLEQKIREERINIAKKLMFPQIELFADQNYQYIDNNFDNTDQEMGNGINIGKGEDKVAVGVKLQYSIYNGGHTTSNIEIEKTKLQITKFNNKKIRNHTVKQIVNSFTNYALLKDQEFVYNKTKNELYKIKNRVKRLFKVQAESKYRIMLVNDYIGEIKDQLFSIISSKDNSLVGIFDYIPKKKIKNLKLKIPRDPPQFNANAYFKKLKSCVDPELTQIILKRRFDGHMRDLEYSELKPKLNLIASFGSVSNDGFEETKPEAAIGLKFTWELDFWGNKKTLDKALLHSKRKERISFAHEKQLRFSRKETKLMQLKNLNKDYVRVIEREKKLRKNIKSLKRAFIGGIVTASQYIASLKNLERTSLLKLTYKWRIYRMLLMAKHIC